MKAKELIFYTNDLIAMIKEYKINHIEKRALLINLLEESKQLPAIIENEILKGY